MSESCMNAQEVADLRRPLIFRSRDAHQWIVDAADWAQTRSKR